MNRFDRAHIEKILTDRPGQGWDWFTCHLLRLIARSDPVNRAKLREVYPEEVAAVEKYQYGTREEATHV